MTQLQTLIEEIPKYQPGADLAVLERAYRFSERSHRGQQRASGEPYLSHPLEVASLLVAFKMDVTTVTAGSCTTSSRTRAPPRPSWSASSARKSPSWWTA